MGKYNNWTLGETEALLNIVGGSEIARAVFRGERKLTVEEIVRQQPASPPPLVGRVVKTIIVPAYSAADFAEAVRLGKFDNERDLGYLIRQFAKERVGLDKPTKVDLVGFDREWGDDEVRAWGKANGRPKTIETRHTMGIAIKLPGEKRENPIVALGSRQQGSVLFLSGRSYSDWRNLFCRTVEGDWGRHCLVGFVSE